MPTLDHAMTALLQNTQSTHDKEVGASAAHLLLALRADFSHGEEHDLSQEEHDFLGTPALAKADRDQGLPTAWDEHYPHLHGIFKFIRAMWAHPRYNLADYQKICDNIMRLAKMKKDHWSTKVYHEQDEEKTLQPSMGEVINLVSHGVLNNEAFEVSSKGAEQDRQDRLSSLIDLFLNPTDVCSTGISNDFLFLVDGYKGIRLIELLSGYLSNLALIYAANHLNADYQNRPEALYKLVLGSISFEGDCYEVWLESKKADLTLYLQEHCNGLKLDKQKCYKMIEDTISALDSLDIPTDLNPPVISAMKYFFDERETNKNSPLVRQAILKVRMVLPSLQTLASVADYGLVDFYRAIELMQECERFHNKYYLISGHEVGQTQTSASRLTSLLEEYFGRVMSCELSPGLLMIPEAIYHSATTFHHDIRQYEVGYLIDWVKNFFAILGDQTLENALRLFKKADGYRDALLLTDAKLLAWQEMNSNTNTGELFISPYEINQFIFNALWINPGEWTPAFRRVLNAVLTWLHDDSVRDGLKGVVKAPYVECHLLGALTLLLFLTREDVPAGLSKHYVNRWDGKDGLSARFKSLCEVSILFITSTLADAPESLCDDFFVALKTFNLRYSAVVASLEDGRFTDKHRRLALSALLDNEVMMRGLTENHRVYHRYLSLLALYKNDFESKVRILDSLYASLDGPLQDDKDNLIMASEFASLSFAEKERFLLKCTDPASVDRIFLTRHHVDPVSPHYAILTEKLNAAIDEGELAKISFDAFASTIKALFDNPSAKIEWVRLNKANLQNLFPQFGSLRTFLEMSPQFRPVIEELIMECLEMNRDKAVRTAWRIDELYDFLSESNKLRLMNAWHDGRLLPNGRVDFSDFALVHLMHNLTKKSWESASCVLAAYSPKMLDVMFRFIFKQPSAFLSADFRTEFLPHWFSRSFRLSQGYYAGFAPDSFAVIALQLLSYHFRKTFYLEDDLIAGFMRLHSEADGKVLVLSEAVIARFVMHALHTPLLNWSRHFKAAFKLILQALKQDLQAGEASDLRAPYCMPEFVYNLSFLLGVASLDFNAEVKERASLLDYGVKSTGEVSPKHSLFRFSSAVYFFKRSISRSQAADLPIYQALFGLLQEELSYHIRSMEDVIDLLGLKWLSADQRDLILSLAHVKIEANELSIRSNPYHYDDGLQGVPDVSEDQRASYGRLLEKIHALAEAYSSSDFLDSGFSLSRHSFFAEKAKKTSVSTLPETTLRSPML